MRHPVTLRDAEPHAALWRTRQVYDHCTASFLEQAGVKTTFVRLDAIGIHGNGHLMMQEKNNLDVAAVIRSWLAKTVQ
ncbi:hypothetical protein [Burkholderia contaminans]|uniref:hypothetical protein n=1 Tax=Burkholderia contaminans TaxID=488447 RepID=UPI00158B1BFA|nr:hypothetical protein [Burkholderia contaminans]